MHGAEVMKLVYHLGALGTAHSRVSPRRSTIHKVTHSHMHHRLGDDADVLKLVDHFAALGTANHCLAVVATTREQFLKETTQLHARR